MGRAEFRCPFRTFLFPVSFISQADNKHGTECGSGSRIGFEICFKILVFGKWGLRVVVAAGTRPPSSDKPEYSPLTRGEFWPVQRWRSRSKKRRCSEAMKGKSNDKNYQ